MKKINFAVMLVLSAALFGKPAAGQSYLPEQGDARMKMKPVVPVKAYAFNLKDVKLLESPFKKAMQADVNYLLRIEPDRLLSQFRTNAGLKAKGEKYGGWEDTGLAGHTLGHYLSACAMEYGASGNPEFLKRVNYIVNELAICQQARKTGYVGAIPREDTLWREIAAGDIRSHGFDLNGAWSPWYTVHKIMAGLLDAYLYCGNRKALQVETAMSDWTGNLIKSLNDAQMQKMLLCEYGGMNDVLVNTYAITGNRKYLDLSYRFHDRVILDSLAHGKDILPGRHSNTQIPKLIGTVRRYELTHNKEDLASAEFFWKVVTSQHSYVTGGNSNYEYLSTPLKLNDKLTDNTMETCNTYNMLKLTRHLFTLEPSASLMDYYERGLYNHILASQNEHTGMMCYFVPLRMGGKKEFSDEYNTFTCCVGSGMENHVKYGESIYYKGADGSLYVNLFIPSVLNWKEKGIQLTQQTILPSNNEVSYTFALKKPQSMSLKLRRPHWAKNFNATINGKAVALETDAAGYFVINRMWRNKDVLKLNLVSEIYTEAMPDNARRQAIFYGPVLLAGKLGEKEPDPVNGIPVLVTNDQNAANWVTAANKTLLEFKTTGNTGVPADISLMPFHQLDDQHYSVYWDVFTPEQWTVQQSLYQEQKKLQQQLEMRTLDLLRTGEMQPERDHNFVADGTEAGEDHTRKFRIANNGGSLTFTMKVDATQPNELINTYWGMDNRGRVFDILIDGVKVATEDINKYKESRFYDITYPIPADLTKGKQSVQVQLKAINKGNAAGPLFGSRMVKQ